jgi:pectate lyase
MGCGDGLTDCSQSCVDTNTSVTHCGGCGMACGAGQSCQNGDCGCSTGSECGGVCGIDINTSNDHCGVCNNACSAGQICQNGACQCDGGQVDCSGTCTDTSSDASNCGTCGTSCGDGQTCSNGGCQCSGGLTDCNGSCVDTNTDPANCGTCDTSCSGGCSNGNCTTTETGVIGWAAVSGDGITTTTGGEGGEVVSVSSASELQNAVSGANARIVQLTSNISVSELDIGSNKTIVGMGNNITFSGSLKVNDETNVIIRNLHINATSASGTQDGIHIQRSHHIWVDHVEVWDAPDGNLDINDASNWITISWSIFRYSANPPASDHRYSNLIGSGPAETQDDGRLKVTWHHNWWSERVHERMPRVRYGQIHVFNNLYTTSGNNYCIRAGYRANIRIENNYFDGVGKPHEIDDGEGGTPIIITASGNTYNDTSGAQDTSGTAFSPPYPYNLESPEAARTAIMANAGPQ